MELLLVPGGFSRLRLVASRDTFITLCRDNSNPTESTIISGRISADETNKKAAGATSYIARRMQFADVYPAA